MIAKIVLCTALAIAGVVCLSGHWVLRKDEE